MSDEYSGAFYMGFTPHPHSAGVVTVTPFLYIFRARATGKPDSVERHASVTQYLNSNGNLAAAPQYNRYRCC